MSDDGLPEPKSSAAGAGPQRGGFGWWNLKAKDLRTAAWLGALLVVGTGLLLVHAGGAANPAAGVLHQPAASAVGSTAAAGGDFTGTTDPLAADAEALDGRLAGALGQIAGAGTVTVEVQMATGPVTDYASQDQETSSSSAQPGASGGTDTSVQTSVSRQPALGTSGGAPVVTDIRAADVQGVLVIASGAADDVVRAELTAAVQAVTGVPVYRITVLPGKGGTDGAATPSGA